MELELRQRRNSNYSVRAFARDLKLSPSHLSEFLSGKTSLSIKRVSELSDRLCLSAAHREHWNDLIRLKSRNDEVRKAARLKVNSRVKSSRSAVSLDTFKVISDWYHFAIIAFYGANEELEIADVAKRLDISLVTAKQAVRRLIKVNLLEETERGYQPVSESSFAGDCVSSAAVRESHRQVLVKTLEALEDIDHTRRQSQSLFFSVPKDKVAQLKEEIKAQIFETVSKYSTGNLDIVDFSVQALTWHMYPLEEKKGKA